MPSQTVKITNRDLESREYIQAGYQEIKYNCLFCDDTKYHMYVNVAKRVFHCFKCNTSGIYSYSESERTLEDFESRYKAYRFSGEDSKIIGESSKVIHTLPRNNLLSDLPLSPLSILSSNAYLNYLINTRGLRGNEIKYNSLRYSLDKQGIYSNCIIFPVNPDTDDGVSYFVCRKLQNSTLYPNYVNAPWPKLGTLYRPYRTYVRGVDRILVVCEGVFDAIRIARVFPVAALLGKTATKEQLGNIIEAGYEKICILLDPDAETYGLRLRFDLVDKADDMNIDVEVRQGKLMDKDPGDSTEDEIREAIEYANL